MQHFDFLHVRKALLQAKLKVKLKKKKSCLVNLCFITLERGCNDRHSIE